MSYRFSIARDCSGLWELAIVPDDNAEEIEIISKGSYSAMESLRDELQKAQDFFVVLGYC